MYKNSPKNILFQNMKINAFIQVKVKKFKNLKKNCFISIGNLLYKEIFSKK